MHTRVVEVEPRSPHSTLPGPIGGPCVIHGLSLLSATSTVMRLLAWSIIPKSAPPRWV